MRSFQVGRVRVSSYRSMQRRRRFFIGGGGTDWLTKRKNRVLAHRPYKKYICVLVAVARGATNLLFNFVYKAIFSLELSQNLFFRWTEYGKKNIIKWKKTRRSYSWIFSSACGASSSSSWTIITVNKVRFFAYSRTS